MSERKKGKKAERREGLSRRELIARLGAGAGLTVGFVRTAGAQQSGGPPTGGLNQAPSQNVQHFPDIVESQEVTSSTQVGYMTKTGAGWVNNSGRASGNGPMDECSRRIVEWVHDFTPNDLTPSCIETINYLQNDTLGRSTVASKASRRESSPGFLRRCPVPAR